MPGNKARAWQILREANQNEQIEDLDLLVLPEMVLSGYNFSSLDAIRPYLEPTTAGVSTAFAKELAREYGCVVCVGYPELARDEPSKTERGASEEGRAESTIDGYGEAGGKRFNSLVMVSPDGGVIANYRKTFLYYTDETWAHEGGGFWAGDVPLRESGSLGYEVEAGTGTDGEVSAGLTNRESRSELLGMGKPRVEQARRSAKAAAGICMDINSYKFQAELTEYKFADHVLDEKVKLVILSMAWLTHLDSEELRGKPEEPDLGTVGYWLARLEPLLKGQEGKNGVVDGEEGDADDGEIIVVFANRCGEEGEARYAGSSAVVGMSRKGVRCWVFLGRGEERLCVVDTEEPARWRLSTV